MSERKKIARKRVFLIVGARPNFMKAAPLLREMEKDPFFEPFLIHTGQHYDESMSEAFFRELGLPRPWMDLGVGSGTHAEQTGRIMIAFEKICLAQRPDLVVVVGDVNSTIACALAAVKLAIPVAHVEAGLRSRDRTMPEEINRVLTDQISDFLFTTCEEAGRNLVREGLPRNHVFFVGNVMIDSLQKHRALARKSRILEHLDLRSGKGAERFALMTLHRPSNVDHPDVFRGILKAVAELSAGIRVIFPAHPRTVKHIRGMGLAKTLHLVNKVPAPKQAGREAGILTVPPLGYLDFLALMSQASLVLTDSGGIQEETTILGVPCLTLRNNTERPITVTEGTNALVGNDPDRIIRIARRVLKRGPRPGKKPRLWDGRAAQRIVAILRKGLR